VTLGAGETRTVEFVREIESPGSYRAAVNGQAVTIRVTDNETTTTVENETNGGGLDGFGVLVAVGAICALSLGALRRRR
jgi:hypothetical protein